jgi:hypothetical protein
MAEWLPCRNCGVTLPRDPDRACRRCGMCRVCAWRLAVAKGRCKTDHEYRRRTGRDRPEELVVAHGRRLLAAGVC